MRRTRVSSTGGEQERHESVKHTRENVEVAVFGLVVFQVRDIRLLLVFSRQISRLLFQILLMRRRNEDGKSVTIYSRSQPVKLVFIITTTELFNFAMWLPNLFPGIFCTIVKGLDSCILSNQTSLLNARAVHKSHVTGFTSFSDVNSSSKCISRRKKLQLSN